MAALIDRLRSAGRAIFGELSWRPPGWLAASSGAARRGLAGLNTSARANPRRAALIAAAFVAIVITPLLLWRWYESQPKPVLTDFAVAAPGLTCYACEPPSPPHPLVVTFSSSAATLERAGHPVDAKQAGIDISPAVAGQWFWDDDRTLTFRPAADWPIGQR